MEAVEAPQIELAKNAIQSIMELEDNMITSEDTPKKKVKAGLVVSKSDGRVQSRVTRAPTNKKMNSIPSAPLKIIEDQQSTKAVAVVKKRVSTTIAPTKSGSRIVETTETMLSEKPLPAKKTKAAAAKAVVSRTKKASNTTLSEEDTLTKYMVRLQRIPAEEFAALNNCYISVYDPSFTGKSAEFFEKNPFPLRWTRVLKRVAESKGCNIVGVLPHNSQDAQGLRKYRIHPEIVSASLIGEYQCADPETNYCASRVFVGKKSRSGEPESQFALLTKDHHVDEEWKTMHGNNDAVCTLGEETVQEE